MNVQDYKFSGHLLGSGSFADVMLAHSRRDGREVAIKMVRLLILVLDIQVVLFRSVFTFSQVHVLVLFILMTLVTCIIRISNR